MRKYIFGYVILHYLAFQDTVKCASSIMKIDKNSYIVIVNNDATEESDEKLKYYFRDFHNVIILTTKVNMGYARGNNIGIDYLLKNIKCDFIIVCNNDIIIRQKELAKEIITEYLKSDFAILGPKIVDINEVDLETNPVRNAPIKYNQIRMLIMKRKVKWLLCKLHLSFLVHNAGTKSDKVSMLDSNKRQENVQLHGSFLIFSKNYFKVFHGFDNRTFLFFEEDILFRRVLKENLKIVYSPKIKVIHSEDGSINMKTRNNRERNLFIFSNEIKSLKVLLKI
ncbi:glycosyltransferase [Lactiplantibacillus plantarum]|uniref:glycosyltransferase n=1 Tax=Lactiplantibacillus plantarum TaxID=1590 RepID=UPI003F53DD04